MSTLTCTRQLRVGSNVQTMFKVHHYHIKLFWLFFFQKDLMFMQLGLVSLVYFYLKDLHKSFPGAMAISPHFSPDDLKSLVKLKGRHLTSFPCSSTIPIINVLLHLLSLVQSNFVISFMCGLSVKFLISRCCFDDLILFAFN